MDTLQRQVQSLRSDLKSCKSSLQASQAELERLQMSSDGVDNNGGGRMSPLPSHSTFGSRPDDVDGYRGTSNGGSAEGTLFAASLATQRLENEIDRARQEASEWKEKYGSLESKLGVLARSHSLLRQKMQSRPGTFGTPSPHKMMLTPNSDGKGKGNAKKRGFFSALKL